MFPDYKETDLDSLIPYARNSRTHSDEQINKIAASIKEFGFLNPVITDGDNGIVAGHGRVLAAKKLGMETLPIIEAKHLTEAQKRAYIIADNRLALDAGWDNELLSVEFEELAEYDFNLELTGFSKNEIDSLMFNGNDQDKIDSREEDYKSVCEVVVECEDEIQQEAIYKMMTEKGLKCRVLSM